MEHSSCSLSLPSKPHFPLTNQLDLMKLVGKKFITKREAKALLELYSHSDFLPVIRKGTSVGRALNGNLCLIRKEQLLDTVCVCTDEVLINDGKGYVIVRGSRTVVHEEEMRESMQM